MFSAIKQRLGLVSVEATPTYITIEGINTYLLFKDIYAQWGSSVIQTHMFTAVRRSMIRFRHFFGLDFLYICNTLYNSPKSRLPKRILAKVIDELKAKTWLGQVDRNVSSITDVSAIEHLMSFPPKPHQREFVAHYGKIVPAYRLRGYMLDAGPGTGKTAAGYMLNEALKADKMIIITPKNAAERVWADTIDNLLIKKKPYWISTSGELPTLNHHYYICHYESLDIIVNFVKTNASRLKNIYVHLDESHNFNRGEALRTQAMIDLCKMKQVSYCTWASGTPLMALGTECIPFLKCVDPMFDEESEERFRKIYGRDAKRANDILRNRIGHLKFHVPKQDVVDIVPEVIQVKVTMPTAKEYTLASISEKMRKFIAERQEFYSKNFDKFQAFYDKGIEQHVKTLNSHQSKVDFETYKSYFNTICAGFDPVTMKTESRYCNNYELRVILPSLDQSIRNDFKASRSVIKYVDLKILGEALGTVLGKMRAKCHVDMIDHIDFSKIIDGSKKKTLIFTSYVEVVEKLGTLLAGGDYIPSLVYGATNKNLPTIVSQFYKDQDINPLIATFQSLSTAVPLTAANTVIMINQPFRSGIREQTIARAARLGQDEQVYVYDCLLDTGDEPNISTRTDDIMRWSAEQCSSILGIQNVDLDSLTLEAKDTDTYFDHLIETASMESETAVSTESHQDPTPAYLPLYLYHGSAYAQNELMPGFKRSGELVKWDGVEDNTWLYAASDREDAISMAIGSAIEKKWMIDRFAFDDKKKLMTIEMAEGKLSASEIEKLEVYLYTLRADTDDGWQANINTLNGMKGEYKTQRTIIKNILRREQIDISSFLRGVRISIT